MKRDTQHSDAQREGSVDAPRNRLRTVQHLEQEAHLKRYFVEHVVDTPMSVGDRHQHQVGPRAIVYNMPNRNASISIFDSLSADKRYGITTSNGLGIHIYLDADDLDDAIRAAKDTTEVLLGTLSFASLSECPPANWRRAYEATPGLSVRRYRQYFTYHVPGTMQQVKTHIYSEIFRTIDPLPDERILRAMTWFRKALSQDNAYDELVHYWSVLETLDGLLEATLATLPLGFTNTNRGRFKEPPSGKGMIRFFVRRLHYKPDQYWKLKNTRNEIVHGLVPLSRALTKKVRSQLPVLRRSCIAALGYVLGIKPQVEKAISEQILARGEPFSGHMEVDIDFPVTPPLAQIGQQPWIEFPPNKLTLGISKDGTLNARIDVKIGKTVAHNAKLLGEKIDFAIYGTKRRSNLVATHKGGDGIATPLTPRKTNS